MGAIVPERLPPRNAPENPAGSATIAGGGVGRGGASDGTREEGGVLDAAPRGRGQVAEEEEPARDPREAGRDEPQEAEEQVKP